MYQGIINTPYQLQSVTTQPGLKTLTIKLSPTDFQDVTLGASIAIDGVCLTVSKIDPNNNTVSFDAMQETLNKTTIGVLNTGDFVNLERSAKFGQEIGGHEISGHVDTTAEIVDIQIPENNYIITFRVDKNWTKYIFSKGYLAVNGASLTVTNFDKQQGTFQVYLIPETLERTTFKDKKVGDKVNIEIDRKTQVIVETVESLWNAGLRACES